MVSFAEGYAMISLSDQKGGWPALITQVGNRRFVTIDRLDARCGKIFRNDFRMVDEVIKRRNEATDAAMIQADSVEADPMGDQDAVPQGGPLKRSRKECLDQIANMVQVTTTCENGGSHAMWVLTSASHRARLSVEFLEENFEWLQKSPSAEVDEFIPELPEGSVSHMIRWLKCRHSIRCNYYDGKANRWRWKSMTVKKCQTNAETQEDANKIAAVMMEFFRQHHYSPELPLPNEVVFALPPGA
ncbi:unnamed protein product [Prorocentrum cordatum]|uniref:Uncharacterized protein n=1 Tax=Prorocentrum cordatum TaxID=2364126 RepID=A0ABN9R4V8_9DINO|nr:unnamed protein product [Polarella glacialis]